MTVAPKGDLEGWLGALERELAMVSEDGLFSLGPGLATLFVGGGTPSLMGPTGMAGLAGVLGPDRLTGPSLEWTAEANPESFTRETADAWSRAGVNRVSLGAQSFHDPALQWMGRLHREEDPGIAVDRARAAGIENINLDLIFGLPHGIERDWARDLDLAAGLEVPHLSLYGLSVEKGTPLGRAIDEGHVSPASEDRYRGEFLEASNRLSERGYRQYEVSNFAMPGFEARHNLVYWSHEPYLGLGNSAHSFRFPHRRWNLKDWQAYQKATRSGRVPWEGEEELTAREFRLERIWLGLRTERGVKVTDLNAKARARVDAWVSKSWALVTPERVRLTPEGWLMLDSLVLELDSALEWVGS